MVSDSVEALPVKFGIAAEKHQPFNVTNGLAGVRMGHCACGKGLLVMPHDKSRRMQMRKIIVTAERRQGVGLIFGTIDEARRKRLPSAKRCITDPCCAAGDVNALIAFVTLHDFGFRRNGLRPLRTKYTFRSGLRDKRSRVRPCDIRHEKAAPRLTFVDETAGKHAKVDNTAKMINAMPAPIRVAKQLQGATPGVGTKRGLVEHLIQIDLEGETDFRTYNQLPNKKQSFQKAVMPPIGAVDTEHGLGMAVAGANRIDNIATMRFVKKEDAKVPEFQMAGDQIPT